MKKLVLLVAFVICANMSTAQTKIGDVTLPNEVTLSGEEMTLNGAGMREKMWIDLYAGGLYVQTKSSDATKVINSDAPMAMKLHIVSGMVSQSKMIGAVNDGFENSTIGKATVAEKAAFIKCFNDEITKADVFDIAYANGVTTVYKNGEEKGTVAGLEFKKALFGIWLGKKPADKDLKKGMLGK
jgi:hypothetical protein